MSRKTVVELDLVGYGDLARNIEENVGVKVVAEVNAQIQGFIDAALKKIGAERYQAVLATTGDGAILAFQNPDNAHNFAVAVHQATEEHNSRKIVVSAQRWFRIGIATGDLHQGMGTAGKQELAGTVIITAVRLEAAAGPGEIVADATTFGGLSPFLQRLYGPEEKVKGKRNEEYAVNRYSVIQGTDKKNLMPTVRTVFELFDRLNPRDQLARLMQLLEMPIQHRPPDSLTLFRRQDAIVDWAANGNHLERLADSLKYLVQRQESPLA